MKKTEKESEVIKLYGEQKTPTEISKELGIGRRTVYRIINRNGMEYNKKEETGCKLCGKTITSKNFCQMCSVNIRRFRVKEFAIKYLGGKCVKCEWEGDLSGYDFHHRDPKEKDFNSSALNMANMSWDKVKNELDKCDLLCVLCHRLEHSNYSNEKLREVSKNYQGKLFK